MKGLVGQGSDQSLFGAGAERTSRKARARSKPDERSSLEQAASWLLLVPCAGVYALRHRGLTRRTGKPRCPINALLIM